MQPALIEKGALDYAQLNRELDRAKSRVFMEKNGGFMGALMCYLNFSWNESIPTAATNGVDFFWNPHWFQAMPAETRKTVLMHELWHCALLHIPRLNGRDPKIWNYATDIMINNMLEREGFSFTGVEPCWKDQSFGEMAAEQIYEILIQKAKQPPPGGSFGGPGQGQTDPNAPPGGQGDLQEATKADKQVAVANVVQAAHAARMGGQAGSVPGSVEKMLRQFLEPVIPWDSVLHRFLQEKLNPDFDWRVRDRRFPSIYLPGEMMDLGGLQHLAFYFDVSGSVTDPQTIRFNSEVKYIWETYKPELMTVAQFDTRITWQKVFADEEPYDEIIVVGRGGTNLEPVRQHMIQHQPTAAVIFSDLQCAPMKAPPKPIPAIWIAIANKTATVPFGELIHIKA